MPGEVNQDSSTPPRSSIFLSYASADRVAARALRDNLEAAGLDVWLDEEELAGGEAWDAKIRNQIRTCTYFMPIISATTEARGEGYFRREWRLAVERTLDLADDIMFLVPVVIDETRDAGARVPEKFFAVQWLRVPAGKSTAALTELAEKLARGEAIAVAAPTIEPPRTRERSRHRNRSTEQGPPPFPAFPAFPEPGQRIRFCYNLILWAGQMLHSIWGHLPRAIRGVAAAIIIFNLISWAFRDHKNPGRADAGKIASGVATAEAVIDSLADEPSEKSNPGAIEAALGAAAEVLQAGRPVAVVKFSGGDATSGILADEVFGQFLKLLKETEKIETGISPIQLKADATDTEILDRGIRLKSRFVLCGFSRAAESGRPQNFTAKLYDVKAATLIWTESYDSPPNDAVTIARYLAIESTKRTHAASSAP